MIATLIVCAALAGTPDIEVARADVQPTRAVTMRPALGVALEGGVHTVGGNGLLFTFNPSGRWTLESGVGWAPAGITAGLRGRYNFMTGHVRPFVGLGLSHSFGNRRSLDRENSARAEIEVPNSTYAQALGGVSAAWRGGLFALAGVGYRRLLGDSNVRVRSGAITKKAFTDESTLVGSGVVVTLAAGYAF